MGNKSKRQQSFDKNSQRHIEANTQLSTKKYMWIYNIPSINSYIFQKEMHNSINKWKRLNHFTKYKMHIPTYW